MNDDDQGLWACANCGKPQPLPDPRFCSLRCRVSYWITAKLSDKPDDIAR